MPRRPRDRSRILSPMLVALALATPPSASAIVPVSADLMAPLPPAKAAEVRRIEAAVRSLRDALATPSYERRVRALYRTNGLTLPRLALPHPGVRVRGMVAPLPHALREPVAILTAAVREAARRIGPLPRAAVQRSIAAIADHLSSLPRRARHAPVITRMRRPGGARSSDVVRGFPGLLPPPRSLAPAVRRALGRDPLAALLVAQALDVALPSLIANRHAAPRGDGSGCDLVEQPPVLCVGSTTPNAHDTNALLVLDLGGDDMYTNTAGGAPFLPEDSPAYLPLSLNVDLGGNDTYDSRTVVPVDLVHEIVGEGAGTVGAVGIAVDLAGDDTYASTIPEPPTAENPPPIARAYSIVQGAGAYGVGLLFDEGGSDTYTVTDRGHDEVVSSGALAQGMGAAGNASGCTLYADTAPPFFGHPSCSLGALLDSGGGDDGYQQDLTQPGTAPEYFRTAIGQGMGQNVAGILADDGGSDRFRLSVTIGADGPTGLFGIPTAIPIGQGWGAGGAGILLEGEGPTEYGIEALQDALAHNYEVGGQGFGLTEGVGILDDLGGDDTYVIRSDLPVEATFTVDDSCRGPDEAPCPQAERTVVGNLGYPLAEVRGQGLGQTAAVGLLHDHRGSDDYLARSSARLTVGLRDRLTAPQGPPRLEVTGLSSPLLWVQGFATGAGGTGLLHEDAGTDTYTAEAMNEVHAWATSDHGGPPRVTAFAQNRTFIGAQGGSITNATGVLLDAGGYGDRFTATSENIATTSPPGGNVAWGGRWPIFQGAGRGVFAALGENPGVTVHPTNGVSPQSPNLHGAGEWLRSTAVSGSSPGADPSHQVYDSAGPLGLGLAPLGTAAPTGLTFLDETASEGSVEDAVPVAARATAGDGTPLPGVPVTFTLQYGGNRTVPGFEEHQDWATTVEVQTVTDPEGVARARLPLDVRFYFSDPAAYDYRLLATVDAAPGRYPAHAVHPFALTS